MSDGGASTKAWTEMEPNTFFWKSYAKKLPEFTVVKLGVEPHGSFSKTVRDYFRGKFGDRVAFMTVEVSEIDHRLELVRDWILKWRKQLGWKPSTHTPTGYYVFSGLDVLAYANEVPTTREREAAFGGATTSFAEFERIANRLAAERVAGALVVAADALDVKRRAEAEAKARAEREAAEAKARQERETAEKLERRLAVMKRPPLTQRDRDAIKLLGVPEDYTRAELVSAKRTAQKRVHPDVSKLSAAESNRRSAACNDAFDVLNARIR